MKNIAFTLLMMLFVGVGTSMAQDKKAADADATVKTEKHSCTPDAAKACCSKDSAAKKSCTAEEKAKCAHGASSASTEGKAEEHDHSSQPH